MIIAQAPDSSVPLYNAASPRVVEVNLIIFGILASQSTPALKQLLVHPGGVSINNRVQ
jgi:hypothetical protein